MHRSHSQNLVRVRYHWMLVQCYSGFLNIRVVSLAANCGFWYTMIWTNDTVERAPDLLASAETWKWSRYCIAGHQQLGEACARLRSWSTLSAKLRGCHIGIKILEETERTLYYTGISIWAVKCKRTGQSPANGSVLIRHHKSQEYWHLASTILLREFAAGNKY